MKFIILICDGMADLPEKEFGNKTPLEYAETPNFDALAKKGINGIMDPVAPGVTPGSDTGHLSILGYDIKKDYCGRGPLEALGAELSLKLGEVAFRVNFATVDENFVVKDRRAGRIKTHLEELEEAINSIEIPIDFTFHHTVDHRGALVLKSGSEKVSNSDPHKVGVKAWKVKPTDNSEEAKHTAEVVNEFIGKAHEVMKDLPFNKEREFPANYLLLRGAGKYKTVESIEERYGLKGACVAAVALVRGVAKYIGLDLLEVEGMTGNEKTDIKSKFDTALNALDKYDFVLVNVKAPDIFGHDEDFKGKAKMIEKIDKYLPILAEDLKEDILVVTADHATPVSVGCHSADPVPICIVGKNVRADEVVNFGERECIEGSLGRIVGNDIIPTIKKLV